MMTYPRRVLLLAAAVCIGLAGCTTTVAGSSVRARQMVGGIDLGALDTGKFPTSPLPPFGRAGNVHAGALLEARRMASNVVPPFQVDPSLSESEMTRPTPLQSAEALSLVLPKPIPEGAANHNFVTGFSTTRGGMTKILTNVVLRFATPEDAAAAAADMTAKSTNIETNYSAPKPTHPIPIPRYPATSAAAFEVVGTVNVFAYTAHGPYVLCQSAQSSEGADAAADLVAATLDLQVPLIDQFSATPVEQLPELPIDPTGLWARTLPPGDLAFVTQGVYDARGILHFQDNPARSQQLFNSVGLQNVAVGRANVYETPNAATAARVADDFVAEVDAHNNAAPGVRGLPGAKCFTPPKGSLRQFYCVAPVDKYVIEVSDEESEARQEMAAQYMMLTAK